MSRRTRQTCPACIAAAAEAAVAEHAHTASRQQQSQRPAPRRRRTALLALSACLLRADALLTGSVHAVSSSSSSSTSSRFAQRSATEQQRQRIATVLYAASSAVSSSSSSSSSGSSNSADNIVLPGLRHNRPPRTDEGTFRSPKQKVHANKDLFNHLWQTRLLTAAEELQLGTLVQEMMALEGRKADMIASAADAAAAAAAAADESLADIIGGAEDDAEDVRALLAVQEITFAERAAEAGMGEAEFVAVLRRGYWVSERSHTLQSHFASTHKHRVEYMALTSDAN
jgi:hypothetical protein